MAIIPKQVYEGQPGTGTAVLATVPTDKRWFSIQVVIANTSSGTATVTLGKNGSGVTKQFCPTIAIPGFTTETLDLGTGVILTEGQTIDGLQGTAGAITVHIGAMEQDE